MDVRVTHDMLEALRETPEIPDNLLACVNGAMVDGGGFVLELDGDEAMAMTEMCEWYIRKDPVSGKLTDKAKLFDGIVQAIYDADLA